MSYTETEDSWRPLTGALILGILIFPVVFVWLLLRPGYSLNVRIGAFAYLAMGIIGLVLVVLG